MDTNLFWALRGDYQERRRKLSEMDRAWLEATILDSEYNNFLRARADYEKGENDRYGHGKRLPYIGWFWRHIEFSEPRGVPIGNCGEFIGFMENNKWDYPERCLTPKEHKQVMKIIDAAMAESERGGDLSEINRKVNAELDKLWDYMQTLKV